MKIHIMISSVCLLSAITAGCGDDSTVSVNHAPVIQILTANPDTVDLSQSSALQCTATDEDNDILFYNWSAGAGSFPNGTVGTVVFWSAPAETGNYFVMVNVSDGRTTDRDSIELVVMLIPNQAPVIQSVSADPDTIVINGNSELSCVAVDQDGDLLTYVWSSPEGSFPGGNSGPVVQWQAPGTVGNYFAHVTVDDGRETAADSVEIFVVDLRNL